MGAVRFGVVIVAVGLALAPQALAAGAAATDGAPSETSVMNVAQSVWNEARVWWYGNGERPERYRTPMLLIDGRSRDKPPQPGRRVTVRQLMAEKNKGRWEVSPCIKAKRRPE